MKKNHPIIIQCTAEEKAMIKKKAEKCGMNLSTFIRFLALRTSLKNITNHL